MKDLLGNEITYEEACDILQVFKASRAGTPKGYAARPGSGPVGETCGTCTNAWHVQGGTRAYWKCALLQHRWTNSYGTDIRLKSAACQFWKPEHDK